MTAKTKINSYDPSSQQLNCHGNWDVDTLAAIKAELAHVTWPKEGTLIFNGKSINKLDSAGAWLIFQLKNQFENKGLQFELNHFSEKQTALIQLIGKHLPKDHPVSALPKPGWLESIGAASVHTFAELTEYLTFLGYLTNEALRLMLNPGHWRIASIANVIYRDGYLALPIIALLSFMIGVVISYQLGVQLKPYGANIYIVDLIGISVLREFAPLITAIMVAGRTGSAFTAQLGMMRLNQEIDALTTMGITPAELLLLPRIIGLFIALPLLTMWANLFGVSGGMIMANNMLGISWYDFLYRFPSVVPLKNLFIGMGKAPVFALIIASIGCFQGMKVEGSAESLGRNTTRSVVLAIFFIILADAAFSILFSKLKL